MRSFRRLSALMAFCSVSIAQTSLVPAEVGSTDQYTFFPSISRRLQCVYDSNQFLAADVGHPILITGLSMRFSSAGAWFTTMTFPNVNIYLQASAIDGDVVTTSFAAAHSAPLTQPNYSGPLVVTRPSASSTDDAVFSLPLQIPFAYTADAGADLLVEIEIPGPATPMAQSYVSLVAADEGQGCRILVGFPVTASTGSWYGRPPQLRIDYLSAAGAAKTRHHGAPCLLRTRSFYEHFTGGVNNLAGKTVLMQPNAIGGYDVSTTPGATIATPIGAGLALTQFGSAMVNLPFAFDYPGGSTTQVKVGANGEILLSGTQLLGAGDINPMIAPGARLLPCSHTMSPDGATNLNNVFAGPDPANPGVMLITWNNVATMHNFFAVGGRSTYQVALIDNGVADRVEFRYQVVSSDGQASQGNAVAGFAAGRGFLDPGSRDLTSRPFSSEDDKPVLSLRATRPVLGSTVNLVVDHVPAYGTSVVFLCAASIPETDLAFLGLQGCRAYVQLPEFSALFAFGLTPTATMTAAVPMDPSLNGLTVFAQAAALDPMANPFGAITGNAVDLTVGSL